jgi:hypothetical protein
MDIVLFVTFCITLITITFIFADIIKNSKYTNMILCIFILNIICVIYLNTFSYKTEILYDYESNRTISEHNLPIVKFNKIVKIKYIKYYKSFLLFPTYYEYIIDVNK